MNGKLGGQSLISAGLAAIIIGIVAVFAFSSPGLWQALALILTALGVVAALAGWIVLAVSARRRA